MEQPDAVLIAGPTASGKSKLALEWAERVNGEIINADSMQLFAELSVLSARPDAEDLARVPHHLYASIPGTGPSSVMIWLERAVAIAQEIDLRGRVPIFVGGTGLYFRALEQGLARVPEIAPSVREDVRQRLIQQGSEKLYGELQELDPRGAQKLRPSDGQRIARALEVVLSTGEPLALYQRRNHVPGPFCGARLDRTLLMPPRAVLHERINLRTKVMMENGAIDEVRALLALNYPPQSPVLRAIGVEEVGKYIRGDLTLDESIERIRAATRQYAKRQCTWFRGQFGDNWQILDHFGQETLQNIQ